MKTFNSLCLVLLLSLSVLFGTQVVLAQDMDPASRWKPKFDPSGAQYTYLLSCVGDPTIEGVGVGYRIRDLVWEKSGGRLFVDFRPRAQLGDERDVIRKLQAGEIQGMMSSSVAAANVSNILGIVNLPFVIDTFDRLEQFRNDMSLWQPFQDAAINQNLIVTDITGYGSYGWATASPVRTIEEAKGVNFRIAEAPVNIDFYDVWGLKFAVMPWSDVPAALKAGSITGLDHTPIVCKVNGVFDILKNYTRLDYAQGLYIHLTNTRWLNKLPEDLRKILLDTITRESAFSRTLIRQQQDQAIKKAKSEGVAFYTLSPEEKSQLIEQAKPMYDKWGERIGADYLLQVRSTLGQ